ncbi:hypothetical protein CK623_00160 [Vandammella animalimorsus]|uniref:Uncharacterized protein n=1 Tax=Vandammella animalimorsus TaxID=2029117 RepID=A0A2A2AUR9_9BURK|nr:major capsid protein [Vandammella animalimorsus]PAT41399.1 hypothetical protein CK623_00160 [Vandammella animalimorsus]
MTITTLVPKAVASRSRNVVKRLGLTAAAVAAPLVLVGNANAQSFSIDAAPIVSVITGAVTTVSAIGVAVLSLVVVIRLFKWVQRVL